MNFLIDICAKPEFDPIWNVVGFVVDAIWIGIPIILVVLGMIDLGKAVIASKEDEVKKATKAFGKRFIYAVAVFIVVWLVKSVLTLSSSIVGDATDYDESWQACWCKINKGTDYTYTSEGKCVKK